MSFIKDRFMAGGYEFMSVLTLELIIAAAWIIYQFIKGYNSKQPNKVKILRKIGYGKQMGVFALVTGFLGQMIGLMGAFEIIKSVPEELDTRLIFDGIGVTMISASYGVLIFLITMMLWFTATVIIEKKYTE